MFIVNQNKDRIEEAKDIEITSSMINDDFANITVNGSNYGTYTAEDAHNVFVSICAAIKDDQRLFFLPKNKK